MRSTPTFIVPSFTDLTIRKQYSSDAATSWNMTEVLYLKGARERREFFNEQAGDRHAVITQCDRRRSIQLNPGARLFAVSKVEDWSEPLTPRRPLPEELGAEVTTTFDAVDTGERRRVGQYVARRVRTTITVEPSPGANTPASTRETDGWYIDLPGLGCSNAEAGAYLAVGEIVRPGGLRDRHRYKTKGTARRGYAIEETNRVTQSGTMTVDNVKLIELSEHTLDPSLFEIPRDYRPALPLLRGGIDLTKPDTVANRLQMYWHEVTQVTRSIFR
jgi:hypothetical protein